MVWRLSFARIDQGELSLRRPDALAVTAELRSLRRLIESRTLDVLQPDVMWVGGLTELLRIAAHASAYDIPVIPHGSGPYSYHFIASQAAAPLCEYVAASADGRSIRPVFGALFEGEALPENGILRVSDAPGFGMTIADRSMLTPAE